MANWNKLVNLVNGCEWIGLVGKLVTFFWKRSLRNTWNLILKARIQPGLPPCLHPSDGVCVEAHLFTLPSCPPRWPFSSLPAPLLLELLPPVWTNQPLPQLWYPSPSFLSGLQLWAQTLNIHVLYAGAASHPGGASATVYVMNYLGQIIA